MTSIVPFLGQDQAIRESEAWEGVPSEELHDFSAGTQEAGRGTLEIESLVTGNSIAQTLDTPKGQCVAVSGP